MKQLTTAILLLYVGLVFGQKIHRLPLILKAGDGIQITHKDEFITITGDTSKPCDRCPRFSLDSFAPAFDTIYVVSYDLIERQPLPNDQTETVDKFGRKIYDTYLVYRYKKIYIHQERTFRDWREASDFFMDANRQIDIANLRIDIFLKLN